MGKIKGDKMKTMFILLMCVFTLSIANASEKRYEIKSAQVTYTISGSGETMGMKTSISGEASLLFTDYGKKELSSETVNQTIMGQTQTDKTMTKIDGDKIYSVDFEDRTISEMSIQQFAQYSPQQGEKAMQQMGAKKIGSDKVLGYKCENWEYSGSTICFYKGIMLKSVANAMGTTQTQIATKIDLNPKITSKSFTLPNFKTQQTQSPQEGMPSPEEMNQLLDSLKNMYGN